MVTACLIHAPRRFVVPTLFCLILLLASGISAGAQALVPVLSSSSPSLAYAGNGSFTLTARGANFFAGSQVLWNSSVLTTAFVSSNTLTASVPASLIATVGMASVTVFNPAPGGGTSAAKSFPIKPAQLASVTVSPNSVTGGAATVGMVTLTAPAPSAGAWVTLSSNNAAASLPGSVTIPASATQASFPILTTPVTSNVAVQISAAYGVIANAALTVKSPTIVSLVAGPALVYDSGGSTATVTLSGVAVADTTVMLSSSNGGAAGVPATVVVLAGSNSASFPVTTSPVAALTSVTLSAAVGGMIKTAVIKISPLLSALNLAPTSVVGGSQTVAKITLAAPAPNDGSGGTTVTLGSDSVALPPVTVVVPTGSKNATVGVTTTAVPADTLAHVTATLGRAGCAATLTIKAPVLTSLTINPGTVAVGSPRPAWSHSPVRPPWIPS